MHQLHDRPDLDQQFAKLPLRLVGSLPVGTPGLAYEGRLDIINADGEVSVDQILVSGSLPPGASLTVDNAATPLPQVVIAWPAYNTTIAPIPNANFEAGNVGWIPGYGWSIGTTAPPTPAVETGTKAGKYLTKGYSYLRQAPSTPVPDGRTITARARVNAVNKRSGSQARCCLEWINAAGALVARDSGAWSPQGDAWRWAPVTAKRPENATAVRIAIEGHHSITDRNGWQTRPLLVDRVEWDLIDTIVGTDVDGVWSFGLRVRDVDDGRTATWEGTILVAGIPASVWLVATANSLGHIRTTNPYDFTAPPTFIDGQALPDSYLSTDGSAIWACEYNVGSIWRSLDKGLTWLEGDNTSITGNRTTVTRSGARYFSSGNGFAGSDYTTYGSNGLNFPNYSSLGAGFVIAFDGVNANRIVAVSPDYWVFSTNNGNSFSGIDTLFGGNASPIDVKGGAGRFVAVGNYTGRQVRYTTNPAGGWSSGTLPFTSGNVTKVAFGYVGATPAWVAGTSTGQLGYSLDGGATWTLSGFNLGAQVNDIFYLNGVWVVVGNAGKLATSSDASAWTLRATSFGTADLRSVVAVNG